MCLFFVFFFSPKDYVLTLRLLLCSLISPHLSVKVTQSSHACPRMLLCLIFQVLFYFLFFFFTDFIKLHHCGICQREADSVSPGCTVSGTCNWTFTDMCQILIFMYFMSRKNHNRQQIQPFPQQHAKSSLIFACPEV